MRHFGNFQTYFKAISERRRGHVRRRSCNSLKTALLIYQTLEYLIGTFLDINDRNQYLLCQEKMATILKMFIKGISLIRIYFDIQLFVKFENGIFT